MDIGNVGTAVGISAMLLTPVLLLILAPVVLNYFLFRSTDRLWREGVRVSGVVTRVTPQHMNPTLVSVRFHKPGSGRSVERRHEWMNPGPLPAVGDIVTLVYLPGRWWQGMMLEANLRVAPRL